MGDLKPGWNRVKFGDLVTHVAERVEPTPEDTATYVGLEHMDSGSLTVRRWGSQTEMVGTKLRMKKGDILFARRNAYLRRVAVAPHDGLFSAHGMVLRPKAQHIVPEFLPYFMQSDVFMDRAEKISVGSLSPTINWTSLRDEEFALPPQAEQRRLAALLDSARIAAEACDSAAGQARIVMQALINEHVVGEHDAMVDVERLVREGIIQAPQDGNHGARHPKAADYTESGVPFLMAADFRDGEVDLSSCKCIPHRVAESLRPAFRALPGDVLVTHKGTLGASAILGSLPTPYAMLTPQVTYYRVVDAARLMPDYLLLVMRSAAFAQQLQAHGRQSTRAFVSITSQLRLRVPLPPLRRQRSIVERVLSVRQAALALRNRERLSRLGSAILGNGI